MIFRKLLLSLPLMAQLASAIKRGRPLIDSSLGYNRLVSDTGDLLRGISLSLDGGDPYLPPEQQPRFIPLQASFDRLATEYGFNSVHVYLEGNAAQNPEPAGINQDLALELRDKCELAGLYLIITIGCNGENGQMNDVQKAIDFWSIYAPLLGNETHVIFEVHNEPVAFTAGHWTQEDVDKQIALHDVIRPAAPETMILFFSYMSMNNAAAVQNHVNDLALAGVDWDKAAVAGHGYTALNAMEDVANGLKESEGPPAIVTEYYPPDTFEQYYNAAFEAHGMGWMHFEWLLGNDADLPGVKYKLDVAGMVWIPDNETCSWPTNSVSSAPPDGTEIGLFHRGTNMYLTASGTSEVNANAAIYSGNGLDTFTLSNLGNNLVALQASNGMYLSAPDASTPVAASSSSIGNNEKFIWYTLIDGDIALRAYGAQSSTSGGRLLEMGTKRYAGKIMAGGDDGRTPTSIFWVATTADAVPPPPGDYGPCSDLATTPGPYGGTRASVPGLIEAENFDYGGNGVGYNDNGDDENLGGAYRPCEGVDLQSTVDGGSGGVNVGWFDNGEWLLYSVHVVAAGSYSFVARVAGGGSFRIEVDGTDVGGESFTDTGGWQVWADVAVPNVVELTQGDHVLKFVSGGGFNLNWVKFEVATSPPTKQPSLATSSPTYGPTAKPTPSGTVGCVVDAQDCVPGGLWTLGGNCNPDSCCSCLCSVGKPSNRVCA